MTENLTLHYKRVMYLLEPSEASRCAAGHKVLVVEAHDGGVTIEYKGQPLPARAFAKEARVEQGAIADNKVLAAVLIDVRRRQIEREVLVPARTTLREEDLRLKSLGEPGLAVRRGPGRPTIRELALRRMAAEAAPVGGSPASQLIAQTVARLAAAAVQSKPKPSKKRVRRISAGAPPSIASR